MKTVKDTIGGLAAVLLCCLVVCSPEVCAQTAGGTQIQNTATATYDDGQGNNFSASSNTVTVTVANVSGLVITPDAGINPTAVPGQQNLDFVFRATNTGNFNDQLRFPANGQSIQLTGTATLVAAVIDANRSNAIDAGDVDILTNSADVVSAAIPHAGQPGNFLDVIVRVNVGAAAANNSTIVVTLGDSAAGGPGFDNQPADSSAREVRTTGTSANGAREARGDASATVENDAGLRVTLVAPAGPLPLGSDIAYDLQTCNVGARSATAITLGPASGVFLIAPIPVGTFLKAGQSFPAGTLYTASPLAIDPLAATWSPAPPSNLADVTRVAFNLGNSLAASACGANIPLVVTTRTDINAAVPIDMIADAFGRNGAGAAITDQSGDTAPNVGDGNANFNEGAPAGNVDGSGVIQQTTLIAVGSVLNGPRNQPGAIGPTNNHDDFTNRSVNTGIGGVAPNGVTTAVGVVTFTNTLRNTGNSNDTYALTLTSFPAGFTVEISTDGGAAFTVVSGGASVSVPVALGASFDYLVRVTAPAGQIVLTGYETIIRATSTNTPGAFNDTIDRLYTGFIKLEKASTIINPTGAGNNNDAVPGAIIEYTITYTNVSSAGGTGNVELPARHIQIREDGNAAPNTWGTTTEQIVGSTSDTRNGTITGDAASSSVLTDDVPLLSPGQSGIFKFRRTIK